MATPKKLLSVFAIALVVVLAFLVVPGVTDSGQKASADGPYTLIYYDGHMHTERSDGTGSVAQIKATALSHGLSAVIITDHCYEMTLAEWQSLVAETAAASEAGTFLALPGYEITGSEGLFNRAHMNAYNAPDPFVGDDALELCPEEVWPDPPNPAGTGPMYPDHLAAWVEYVHSQGGIVNHNHTSGSTQLSYGVDNIEIYNQGHVDDVFAYAKMFGYTDEVALGFAITLNNFALYGERDVNTLVRWVTGEWIPMRLALYYATYMATGVGQWLGSPEAPLRPWDEFLMAYVNGEVDRPTFGVANSDAHNTSAPLDSKVGSAKNGLYVTALTPEAIYEAIEAGRSFGTTGPSLDLDLDGKLMGETAYVAGGTPVNLNLSVNSESPTAALTKIDILKNGTLWQTISPMSSVYEDTFDDTVTESGYYRVEVTSQEATGAQQFAYSNPVFVSTAPVADLKVVTQYVENPPAEILPNQDVQITLDKIIHNNGPYGPVDAATTTTVTAPSGCTVSPNPHTQSFHDVPVSVDILHHEPFTIRCSSPGSYTFTFDDTVDLNDPEARDPEAGNNAVQTELTVRTVARADVKITSASFANPPTKIPLAQNVDVTLRKHIHNNGPWTPVNISIAASATPPTGCTIVPKNVPSSLSGVPVSVDQVVDEVWTISCSGEGLKTFAFNNSISVSTPNVVDPNLANNAFRKLLTVRDPAYPYWGDDICDGLDNDGDTVIDEDWDLNGNTVADCLDPALDTDRDGQANDVDLDDDGDGWSSAKEGFMRIDPLSACPVDRAHDAWPPDVKNDRTIDILDVVAFIPVLNGAYDRRFDLNADSSVNVLDVVMYRVLIGMSCTL